MLFKPCKKLLKICDHNQENPYIALLNLRSSPQGDVPSPSELLMSRKLNNRLPLSLKILKPKCHFVRNKLVGKKVKCKTIL